MEICKQCKYIKKVKHLESREQKLIEKLEEDKKEHTYGDIEIDATGQYAKEILSILKGENHE